MSRTFRFRNGYIPWFADTEWDLWEKILPNTDITQYSEIRLYTNWVTRFQPLTFEGKIDPTSKRGKCIIGKATRDKWHSFKEPGPHWFRNLYSDRPLRRLSKRELNKFKLNPDYEPYVPKRYKLDYWT